MTGDLGPENGSTPDPTLCLDDAAYVLGSLSPTERQAYEHHLAGCPKCQASVGRLAGLPGLLAGTSPADVGGSAAPLPGTLLPGLLTAVARERRRRVVLSGFAGAAAAAVIALVVALVTRPGPARPEVPVAQASTTVPQVSTVPQAPTTVAQAPTPVAMTPLVSGPMNVSLQLSDKQWGTSVVVHCAYVGGHRADVGYRLVAFDPAGKPQTLGWWTSVAGSATTVTTASSLHLKDISRFEVQLSDGKALLRAQPPRR